jgi:hypothetical protein
MQILMMRMKTTKGFTDNHHHHQNEITVIVIDTEEEYNEAIVSNAPEVFGDYWFSASLQVTFDSQ